MLFCLSITSSHRRLRNSVCLKPTEGKHPQPYAQFPSLEVFPRSCIALFFWLLGRLPPYGGKSTELHRKNRTTSKNNFVAHRLLLYATDFPTTAFILRWQFESRTFTLRQNLKTVEPWLSRALPWMALKATVPPASVAKQSNILA